MPNILLQKPSRYADITVYETDELYGEHGAFRVLQFASEAVQGAMDINRPERIILEYPRAMLHLAEQHLPEMNRAFIIGQGTGTLAKHLANAEVTIAEIDELVAEISRTYFGYAGGPVKIGDGRRLLEAERPGSQDVVILDAFSEKGTPRHLVSRDFFRMAADKLQSDGLILLNVFGRGVGDKMIAAITATLQEAFPFVRVFELPAEHPHEPRNIILAGSRRPISYKRRQMAGFIEVEPRDGHIIVDTNAE